MLALAATAGRASANAVFYLDDPQGHNLVEFQSKTPLESFGGKTSRLTGTFELDPADVQTLSGTLTVDLTSLQTGNRLRDEHMHQNVLHTKEYPRATLTVTGVVPQEAAGLREGEAVHAALLGDLTLHGVTRPVQVDVVATWRSASPETAKVGPGDLVDFEARFTVALSDFGIERPQMLVMKVADEIRVTIRATATSIARGTKEGPDN